MSNRVNSETLTDINNEIESVYEYCLAAGLTHEEIIQKASPLLRPLKKEEWKKRFMTLMKIAICCVALSYTLTSDNVTRSVMTNGRLLMFKVKNYAYGFQFFTYNLLVEVN